MSLSSPPTLAARPFALKQLLKTWGPAWLVMIADVDAASVITAAESGARYGTGLVWFLLLLAVPLYIIQEVAGRIGAVTQKGLGELVRENFSRRIAVAAAVPMAVVDIISYVVEYTGVAVGSQIIGIPPIISVPAVFFVHMLLVYRRSYAQAERPLLIVTGLFVIVWIVAAFLTARRGIPVEPFHFSASPGFLFLLAANVGAVIMPFMLFYQASATAEKRTGPEHLPALRLETAVGAIVSEVIMAAIAVATVGIGHGAIDFAAPAKLASGLTSVAGGLSPVVFAVGLICASFIALIVISLGSSWGFTEAVGWRRRNWFKVYVVESLPAVIVPLISLNLVNLALDLMVLQIVVLLGPGITLGLIAQNRRLMGRYVLGRVGRLLYWGFLLVIFSTGALTIALLV